MIVSERWPLCIKLDHDPHNSRRLSLRELVRRAERANVTIHAVWQRRSASGRGWHRLIHVEPFPVTAVGVVALQLLFGSDPLAFLVIPFGDMLVFGVLVGAGVWFRRNPETHKRLMLLATIAILTAAIARWPLQIMQKGPLAFFGFTDLFIVAGIVYDLVSRRRVHPAYLWGGGLIVISQPLRLIISGTDAWHQFAAAIVR